MAIEEQLGESATAHLGNAMQMLVLLKDEHGKQLFLPGTEASATISTLEAVEARIRKAMEVLKDLKNNAPMWQSYYLSQQLERWL